MSSIALAIIAILSLNTAAAEDNWWDFQYFYHLDVRSFKDTNSDGIGDINGVIEGLNHLKLLKIDTIILSPIYKRSKDCEHQGVEDFSEIDSDYGTIEEFEELVTNAKKIGIKVILDLNLDESSTLTEWFVSSATDVSGYGNFYVWSDDEEDDKILDEQSEIRWKFDETKMKNYQTIGYPGIEYPMLNFGCKRMVENIKDVLKFWMEQGVAGFKIRIKETMLKERNIVDSMMSLRMFIDYYSKLDGEYIRVLIGEFDEDAVDIFEIYSTQIQYCFHLIFVDNFINGLLQKPSAKNVKYIIDKTTTYFTGMHSPTWIISNSRAARINTRIGYQNAENIAMAAFLLPGNVVISQGDEIGMSDVDISSDDDIDSDICKQSLENSHEKIKLAASSPFQWDDSTSAGFSENPRTWIPVGKSYKNVNLMNQKRATKSQFRLYQSLASFRHSPMIKNGDLKTRVLSDGLFAFSRSLEAFDNVIVVMNFSPQVESADLSIFRELSDELIVILSSDQSTYSMGDKVPKSRIRLARGEAVVLMAPDKPCLGPKPVDKIVNKITEAMQKINSYINFKELVETKHK